MLFHFLASNSITFHNASDSSSFLQLWPLCILILVFFKTFLVLTHALWLGLGVGFFFLGGLLECFPRSLNGGEDASELREIRVEVRIQAARCHVQGNLYCSAVQTSDDHPSISHFLHGSRQG